VVGLVLFAVLLFSAPSIPIVALGGMGLAILLSFPVRALSRLMPRGLAIVITFVALIGLFVLGLFYLVPLFIEQLSGFVAATPSIARDVESLLSSLLQPLVERGFLQGVSPEEFISNRVDELSDRLQGVVRNLLGGLVGFIAGAFSVGVNLFGILFVAAYLLADVRKVKAAYLRSFPHRYRRDARELWEAFGVSLSRYLGGLAIVVVIQGVLAGVALYLIGLPYAPLLGVWVSVTAIIPYLGAFLGAIPAVVLALFQSPTIAILTVVVYVLIQQLEGNVLTPRIQGQALHVHPIIVLLAVIGGGQIAGILGVIFAVPALAALRVLFDFFRVRIRVKNS